MQLTTKYNRFIASKIQMMFNTNNNKMDHVQSIQWLSARIQFTEHSEWKTDKEVTSLFVLFRISALYWTLLCIWFMGPQHGSSYRRSLSLAFEYQWNYHFRCVLLLLHSSNAHFSLGESLLLRSSNSDCKQAAVFEGNIIFGVHIDCGRCIWYMQEPIMCFRFHSY